MDDAIVNKIRELREEHGLTQRSLADATGVSQANISRWESGKALPNLTDLWVLADFFGVSIDYLVGREEEY